MKTRIKWLNSFGLALALATGTAATANDQLPSPNSQSKNGSTPPIVATNAVQSNAASTAPAKPQVIAPGISHPAGTSTTRSADQTLSVWAAEILKLVQSDIKEDVILSFIDKAGTFNLSAEQIISLTQSGVPKDLITAMIQHDSDVLTGVRQVVPASTPTSPLGLFLAADSSVPVQSAAPATQYQPRPQQFLPPVQAPNLFAFADDQAYEPPETLERSPVRKPYAEKLTDPIIVWTIPTRMPNLIWLDMCPRCR